MIIINDKYVGGGGRGGIHFYLSNQIFYDPHPSSLTRYFFRPPPRDGWQKSLRPPPPPRTHNYHQQPSSTYHFTYFMSESFRPIWNTKNTYLLVTDALFTQINVLFLFMHFFFYFYAYLEIWCYKYSVKLLIFSGGLGRSPQNPQQFCWWQDTWGSDTTNAGFIFTWEHNHLLNMIL